MFKQKLLIPLFLGLLLIQVSVSPSAFALENLAQINNETLPAEIAVNTSTNTIYVANHDNTISVIDGANNSLIDVIDTVSSPRGIAVNPVTNTVYVSNFEESTLSIIDGSKNIEMDTINVGNSPRGVAVNPTTNTIFVTSTLDNTLSIIDGSQNSLVNIIEVSDSPRAIAVNPSTNTIFITHPFDDTLSIIDGSDYSLIDTISIEDGAFGVGVNHITNTVYVVSCFNDVKTLSVIQNFENNMIEAVDIGKCSLAIGVNSLSGTLYLAHANDHAISVYEDKPGFFENSLPSPIAPIEETLTIPTASPPPEESIPSPIAPIAETIPTEPISPLSEATLAEETISESALGFLQILGIVVVLGIALSAIFALKMSRQRKPEVFPTPEAKELEKEPIPNRRSIKQKMKERLLGSESELIEDSVFERIIQNKIRMIKTLQNSQIGDYKRLESIYNSLTVDGSFSKKDNDYLENQYEEYKKLMHNIGNQK